ncbi:UDP-2,4-diacetamido-2,4,6-trideoxy-beta-L-altropyranose hydrolase [Tenacibaculum maritimum]|uniref:UDP-2,4-diacetamido-2,4, 6-trideoxy-beta-L-altropyranose hydrolase n=1 Tax=Tenacibaculum maritimum TaxID=107401 RepID=UPI0038773595
MTSKKLLFRADGNSIIGLGHLYRLFALVELYKQKADFVFITRESSTLSVVPETYQIDTISNEVSVINEPDWLFKKYAPNEHIVVIDGYEFSPKYQKKLKLLGYSIIYIDDLVYNHQYADIVINHSEGLEYENYATEYYTKLVLGTKYAILRSSFLEKTKSPRLIKSIDIAFICFGGADMYDLSYKAAKALLSFSQFKKINILLGGAYKHKKIFDLEEKNASVCIYQNLQEKEIVSLMEQSNFGIAPASTTLYELCAVKMPILSGYFVENQLTIYESFLRKKAIYGCGDLSNYTTQNFVTSIQEVINLNDHDAFLKNQQKLFDSQISHRLLDLLKYANLSIRKASKEDMLQVYYWSDDLLVRQNSYNSKPIVLEDHKKWFNSKIRDRNTLFYIIYYNSSPAGMVRYEIKEEYTIVGITMNKKFRGKKLAPLFLVKTAKEYFYKSEKPILAYIKKGNTPSIKSFEKAGYQFYKEERFKR